MRKILVDSSVWISFFKNKNKHTGLKELIKQNQVCTNDLILTELIPFLKLKKKQALIDALYQLTHIKIGINWAWIIHCQMENLKHGVNKIGIPDLIILDNVLSNHLILYTEDKHFKLMNTYIHFDLYKNNP